MYVFFVQQKLLFKNLKMHVFYLKKEPMLNSEIQNQIKNQPFNQGRNVNVTGNVTLNLFFQNCVNCSGATPVHGHKRNESKKVDEKKFETTRKERLLEICEGMFLFSWRSLIF
jgi:hypothetical protein